MKKVTSSLLIVMLFGTALIYSSRVKAVVPPTYGIIKAIVCYDADGQVDGIGNSCDEGEGTCKEHHC